VRFRATGRAAVIAALVLAAGAFGIMRAPSAHAQQSGCLPTNIEGEGETDEDALTAARVVGSMQTITITGNVDAAGCGVGVYIEPGGHAIITHADIHGAQAFGVYDNNGRATIEYSQVRDITGNGESCGGEDNGEDNGAGEEEDGGCGGGGSGGMGGEEGAGYTGGRHGTGILVVGPRAHGTITETTVASYGRRGISVSGAGAYAAITDSTVVGRGGGSWQNGIWIANGARAVIMRNAISNNVTTQGGKASSGVMVAGGSFHNGMPNYTTGVQINDNTLRSNDTGVLLSNMPVEASVRSSVHVDANRIYAGTVGGNNHAGINDAGGNNDRINGNYIQGYGGRAVLISPDCIHVIANGNTKIG
jgi:Right handed beta helix region